MSKKVRITLEMDSSFVSLLNVNCQLSGLGNLKEDYKKHSPSDVVALISLLEARGATEDQIYAETPIEWRNSIQVIHSERKVLNEKTRIA